MQIKYNLDPFWIDADEGTKAGRIELFERAIFPIWKGVEVRCQEAHESEATIMHKQDLAIIDSAITIRRNGDDRSAQTKSKLSGQFREAMG